MQNHNSFLLSTVYTSIEREDCQDGDIRLNGTRRSGVTFNNDSIGREGILEMCKYGMWGYLSGSLSPTTAAITCQSLGYSFEG